MKIKRIFIYTLFPVLFLLFILNINVVNASTSSTILNTDKSLGIFRDLTNNEIKTYYSSLTTGSKGDELLSSLQTILKKNQIKLNYNSGSTKSTAWDGYYLLDRDWEKSPLTSEEISSQSYSKTDIWMDILYSTPSIYLEDKINSGTFKYVIDGVETKVDYKNGSTQFDREHVFPKSFGFNGNTDKDRYKDLTAGCDMQNLHAGEHNGNSSGHSNYPYGNVETHDSTTEIKSGITGEVIGWTGDNSDGIKVFEPLDVDKGDIARTIFYMCARYHTYEELGSNDNTPALTLADKVDSVSTLDPEDTKESASAYGELSDLLEWNEIDPVSEFEIHRNNLCYNAIQYNRNPFIDYPEWANIAFGDSSTGINLDTDIINGSSNNESLDVNINSSTLSKGESLNSSNLDVKVDGNTIPLTDLTYTVLFNGIKTEVTNLEEYVFGLSGTYQVTLSYFNESDGKTYTKTLTITITNPYSIKVSSSKTNFISGESFDISMLKVEKLLNGTPQEDVTDYKVYIINHDGSENLITSSYKFDYLRPTSYTIRVDANIDGEIVSDTIEVNVELSNKYKIIIIAAIIIILIIILIIFIIVHKNKKKKKRSTKRRK